MDWGESDNIQTRPYIFYHNLIIAYWIEHNITGFPISGSKQGVG
jgi:hypothetical protein